MKSNIIWLRISYWAAALADFVIAIAVLNPERVGLTEFVYPMALMSAVAFSWGVMLLIADRKPLERRWVLVPTILVVALLTGVRIYGAVTGLVDFGLITIFFGFLMLILLSFSYYRSREIKQTRGQ